MSKEPRAKTIKYEEAIAELERIIERIESGEIGLEESLTSYEHGMKLLAQCRAVLGQVEKRIAELTADSRGNLTMKEGSRDESPENDGEVGDGAP